MTRRGSGPIRVLYTLKNLTTSGQRLPVAHLVRRLDRDRVHPLVALEHRGGELSERLAEEGIEVLELPYRIRASRTSLLTGIAKAVPVFRRLRLDVWHSYDWRADVSEPAIAVGARVPFVYTKTNEVWSGARSVARSALATRIITLNSRQAEHLARPLRRRATHVPIGVEPAQFASTGDGVAQRTALGIPASAFVVACVGHIQRRKGQDVLLDAVSTMPDVHVVLAGRTLEPPFEAQLRRMTEAIGRHRVHFVGETDRVPAILSAADAFALPTREEALGVAILEAMVGGRPVVASAAAGPRDLLDDGVTGILTTPGSTPELMAALHTLRDDPRRRRAMAERARSFALQHFTVEREAERLQGIYEEIVHGRSPNEQVDR